MELLYSQKDISPKTRETMSASERRLTLAAAKLAARQITYGEFAQARMESNEVMRDELRTQLTEIQAAEEKRKVAEHEAQQRAELDRRRREQYAQAEYARQQAAEGARRAAATGMFLQGIGNAFRNAYPQPAPPVRCMSSPIGNSVSTTCY